MCNLDGTCLSEDIWQEDRNVSFSVIYRILKLMVACGLAHEIKSADGVTRYTHDVSETCSHAHFACKDCGALIDP
jgi:Fe2+ or Zn2+ uptake regulation protein